MSYSEFDQRRASIHCYGNYTEWQSVLQYLLKCKCLECILKFYNTGGQVLCLSAMKRETTSNLDCKATAIQNIFPPCPSPTFKWKGSPAIFGSIPLVLHSLEARQPHQIGIRSMNHRALCVFFMRLDIWPSTHTHLLYNQQCDFVFGGDYSYSGIVYT